MPVHAQVYSVTGLGANSNTIADSYSLTGAARVRTSAPPNTPPVAVDDSAFCVANVATSVDVLTNDYDPDSGDTFSILSISSTSAGATAYVQTDEGGWQSVYYCPPEGFTGTDTFTYTISDIQGATSTATVTVQVFLAASPTAVDDSAHAYLNTLADFDVLANDTDPNPGAYLSIYSVDTPSQGGIAYAAWEAEGPVVEYVPAADFSGLETFTYTVQDNYGQFSTATVTVNVLNDSPPVASSDYSWCLVNQSVNIDVLANDSDPGDTFSIVSCDSVTAQGGAAALMTDGSGKQTINYTPPQDFCGSDWFNYTISDSQGATATTVVTVDVFANSPPIAVNDQVSTNENFGLHVNVLANDYDLNDPPYNNVYLVGVDPAANGTTSLYQHKGKIDILYQPNAGFVGTDTFTYYVQNDYYLGSAATVTVTVNAYTNNPPTAVNDAVACGVNQGVNVDVLANDTDPDPGDTLSIVNFDNPSAQGGQVTLQWLSGKSLICYSPAQDFVGTDTISYTISDIQGLTSTATVTVNVVNDSAPWAQSDWASCATNGATNIDVLANDADPDPGDTLSIVSWDSPTSVGGTAVLHTDSLTGKQTLIYSAPKDFDGKDTFNYTISDSQGVTASARVNVIVSAVADNPPVAVNDSVDCPANQTVSIDVLANDSDPDPGDYIGFWTWDSFSIHGGLVYVEWNAALNRYVMTYTPPQDFVGTDTFTYSISDSVGLNTTATVTVNVKTGVQFLQTSLNTSLVCGGDKLVIKAEVLDAFGTITSVTAEGMDLSLDGSGTWWGGQLTADSALGLHYIDLVATDSHGDSINAQVKYTTTQAFGTNTFQFNYPIMQQASSTYLFVVSGSVTTIPGDDSSFYLSDNFNMDPGTGNILVRCSAPHALSDGDLVRVRGIYEHGAAQSDLAVYDNDNEINKLQ